MKKIVIAFEVTDSMDEESALRAMKADNAYKALHDITQLLRTYDKHGMAVEATDEIQSIVDDRIERIRDEVHSIIHENNINLDGEYS